MSRRCILEWFGATLAGNRLTPRQGCTRKVTEVSTGEETTTREPHRVLMANVDDRLMLFGPSLDQIAIVRVKWIKAEQWSSVFFIEHGIGGVNDGDVRVLLLGDPKLHLKPQQKPDTEETNQLPLLAIGAGI